MLKPLLFSLALLLAAVFSTTSGQVLVDEPFDGTSVDTSIFTFSSTGGESFFGRTQLNSPALSGLNGFPEVSNGTLKLKLDTYNPFGTAAGNLFLADEVRTQQQFAPTATDGVSYEVRARFVDDAENPLAPGLVGGIFSFGVDAQFPTVNERDEIDFELLSNFPQGSVLTNVFDDQNFFSAGNGLFVSVPSLDTTQFNDYRIDVETDAIRFFVNGVLVREELVTIASEPQDFRLNINAPDIFFAPAYSSLLQPTADPLANQTYIFEVDSLRITQGSEPVLLGDVNLDDVVNFLDISPFITVLSLAEFQEEADCNEDGSINFLDISPFIALLGTQ